MIKITGRLCLLALCLNLIISISLASADENEKNQNDNFYSTDNENRTGSTIFNEKMQTTLKTFVCLSCRNEYVSNTPPEICSNQYCANPQAGFEEKMQTAQITAYSYNKEKDTNGMNRDNDENNKSKGSEYDFFRIIFMILPWLLVVLCIIFIWQNIYFLRRRLNSTENQLKKFVSSQRKESTELNINQSKDNDLQLEERLSALENDVAILKKNFEKILKALKKTTEKYTEEQQSQEGSQWNASRGEITNNNRRIHNEGMTRQVQLFSKGISTSNVNNKSRLIFEDGRSSRLSPEIQKITVAFNKMMLDSTRLDEGSMDLWRLRNNFIKDYNVIAFRCINSQERVNHPEEQPRFEMCQASEGMLWRIKLSDGTTFAVLPGLREYESTVHFQGGMKELFKSDYKSGTYRKIEMVSPAIVKHDFSINEQGELRLSQ